MQEKKSKAARRIVLVTGANGALGKVLIKALLDEGDEVRGLVIDKQAITELPTGVIPFVGNLSDRHVLDSACDGADTVFHLAANALVKCVLFLSAGNIHRCYASKQLPFVTGAIRRTPVSGWLFLLGFLAITGMPPFAPFISEFNIAAAALTGSHPWVGAAFLALLAAIFLALSDTVLQVVFGSPSHDRVRTPYRDTVATTAPLAAALGLALLLGLWLPRPLATMLTSATQLLEVR